MIPRVPGYLLLPHLTGTAYDNLPEVLLALLCGGGLRSIDNYASVELPEQARPKLSQEERDLSSWRRRAGYRSVRAQSTDRLAEKLIPSVAGNHPFR